MPRIRETQVFKFDELSESAKEKAREWYRENQFDDFDFAAEFVIEDAANVADILGIDLRGRRVKLMNGSTRLDPDITYNVSWGQGDGAAFRGTYSYAKGCAKKIREYAPQDTELHNLADRLVKVQRANFYQLSAKASPGYGWHSDTTMAIEVYRDDEYRGVSDDDEEEVRDILRDFASWIYRRLRDEFEYQSSDEQVDETIRANEYEFTEDGERFTA